MSRAGPGMGGAGRGLLDGVGEDREDAPTPPNPPPSSHRAERVGRWRPLVSPRVPFSAAASLYFCFALFTQSPSLSVFGPWVPAPRRPGARERGRSGGSRRGEGRTEKTIGAPRRDPRRRRGAVTRGLPDARLRVGVGRPKGARGGGRKGAPRCRAAGWEKAGPVPPPPPPPKAGAGAWAAGKDAQPRAGDPQECAGRGGRPAFPEHIAAGGDPVRAPELRVLPGRSLSRPREGKTKTTGAQV